MTNLISPPSALTPGSIVDAYLRDSGGPLQDRSVEQQRNEIEAWCKQYGLVLRKIYADVHKSGGSTHKRDQFEEMIASTASATLRPAGLIIWNFARFARSVDDSQFYKAIIRKRGVVIHSLTDNIPDGPFSSVIETLIDSSNEQKRREAAMGAWRGLRHLVRQGGVPGTPPTGFMRKPINVLSEEGISRKAHRWVPDPKLIPAIRRAFALKAAGSTLAQIHAAAHIFSSVNSYRTFFLNRIYIGTLEFGDLVIENYCEPIIDQLTWDRVQARLTVHNEQKYERDHPRRINSPYVLSGLIYCARCGSPMHGNTVSAISRKKRGEDYRCSRAKRRHDCNLPMINRRVLEDNVLDTVREYILLPDTIQAMQALAITSQDEFEKERAERRAMLNNQKHSLSTQIVNITKAIAESGHSRALLDKLDDLEAQRAGIKEQLKELDIPAQPIPNYEPAQLERLSVNLLQLLNSAPTETVRTILRGFIHKITIDKIGPDLIGVITYYYPPPFDDPPAQTAPALHGDDMSIELISSGPPSVTFFGRNPGFR